MTITTFASGTQTATVGTEHFLSQPNAIGKYQLHVDLSNMASGDVVEFRIYTIVKAGGTSRLTFFWSFTGAQPSNALNMFSEWIANSLTDTNSIQFSLKQTFGTGRNYDYKIMQENDSATISGTPTNFSLLSIDASGRVDLGKWVGVAPNALISGRVDGSVGAYQSGLTPLQPTVAGRTLDVTATGEGGIDWANIGSPTTAQNLSNTTINLVNTATTVTNGVTVTTNNDKTGYGLSAAAIQAIWDALTANLTTVGSIGKRLVDNIDATISSRLASASYTTPPTVVQIRTEMDTNSTKLDVATSTRAPSATAVSNIDYTVARAAKLDNLDTTVSSRSTLTAIQVWQYVVEGALTAERFMRIMFSAMAGKLSGVSTNAPKFRDLADTKDRISATTTADGRTSVTLDGT